MPDIILQPLYGDGPNLPISLPVVLHGQPGASAYEVAQAAGFVGSPADWLASLVGELSETDRDLVRQALDVGTRVEGRLDSVDDAVRTSRDAAEATARDRQTVQIAAGAAAGAARAAGDAADTAAQAARDAADERDAAGAAAGTATGAWMDFSARWLGVRTPAPVGPRPEGALYFDSVTNLLMMWSGGAWQSVATAPAAATLLARLLTVDGPASGLDADLLDGKHATDFGAELVAVMRGPKPSTGVSIPPGEFNMPMVVTLNRLNLTVTDNLIELPQERGLWRITWTHHDHGGGQGYNFLGMDWRLTPGRTRKAISTAWSGTALVKTWLATDGANGGAEKANIGVRVINNTGAAIGNGTASYFNDRPPVYVTLERLLAGAG